MEGWKSGRMEYLNRWSLSVWRIDEKFIWFSYQVEDWKNGMLEGLVLGRKAVDRILTG